MQRRPLITRSKTWAKATACALAHGGFTPNQISVVGLLFAILAGGLLSLAGVAAHRPAILIAAALCIQLRLLCNMLDGLVAVEHRLQSLTGDLFNEIPDRLADIVVIAGLGYAVRGAPAALPLSAAGSLLAVLTAYIRLLGAALGTPQFFLGPMAKPHRMALITGAAILEATRTYFGWANGGESILYLALWALVIGCIVTCYRRVANIVEALQEARDARI